MMILGYKMRLSSIILNYYQYVKLFCTLFIYVHLTQVCTCVPRKLISVFMVDRSSGNLVNIANYGAEYQKEEESPINVLFHGYGHYDILETLTDQKVVENMSV